MENAKTYIITSLAGLIVLAAIIGFSFYQGDHHGAARVQGLWNADALAQSQAKEELQRQSDQKAKAIQTAADRQIDQLNQKVLSTQKRLQNEIAKNSVYSTCILPADGVQLYEDAISSSGQ